MQRSFFINVTFSFSIILSTLYIMIVLRDVKVLYDKLSAPPLGHTDSSIKCKAGIPAFLLVCHSHTGIESDNTRLVNRILLGLRGKKKGIFLDTTMLALLFINTLTHPQQNTSHTN